MLTYGLSCVKTGMCRGLRKWVLALISMYVYKGHNPSHTLCMMRLYKSVTILVNFINVKCTNFSYKSHFGSFFYVHVTRKAAKTTFVQKLCSQKR